MLPFPFSRHPPLHREERGMLEEDGGQGQNISSPVPLFLRHPVAPPVTLFQSRGRVAERSSSVVRRTRARPGMLLGGKKRRD